MNLDETRFPVEEYRGRKMRCGVEIIDMFHGRVPVPDELLEIGKKFGHEPDVWTGGHITAILRFKGKIYKADQRWTPDEGQEFMIFKSDVCGNVTSGRSLFSRGLLGRLDAGLFLTLIAEWAKETKKEARK